jgi:long-subunit fatty acid transport protein
VLVVYSVAAHAGGYYFSDSGIVATGRGGAFVAGAYGQFAQHHNPAGLIHTERTTVNLGWSGVSQAISFRRQLDDGTFLPKVENQADPFDVPEIGIVTPLGPRFALGFGFYSAYAPSSKYAPEGPQRYSIKETGIYEFSVGPSAAFRVHPTLTVGLGLQWHYFDVSQSLDVTFSGQDDPTGDIAVAVRTVDRFTPNVNLGLQYTPVPPVTFGFSAQPGTRFLASGDLSLDFAGNALEPFLDQVTYEDDAVSLDIAIPWVVRAGVAVRPVEKLEIELATVWQDWSALGDVVISDIDVEIQSAVLAEDQRNVAETLTIPTTLADVWSLRLGGEWRAHEHLALRAGGFWESGAVADQNLSVSLLDTPKWQVGGGASGFFFDERLRFDAALAGLFLQPRQVRDSTVTQIGAFDDLETQIVGNGDYTSSGWVVGLGASVAFGQRRTPWVPKS